LTLLTWNHTCSVGVRAMDDQHGVLMDTINELRLALVRGASPGPVSVLLDSLLEFTRAHFYSEEQLMEQHGFPGLEEHRAEHERMLRELRESAHRMQHSENVKMGPLLLALRDGFIAHIENLDQQYGPWLNARGVL